MVTTARLAAALVAGILMLGAAFTVAAVVRLSLYARRDELEIMQLVGAPFSYIRGPFIVEGLLLGGIGAAVALVAIAILYSTLSRWLGSDLAGLAGIGQLRFLGITEFAMMLLGGVGVGAAAGTVAIDEPSRMTSVDTFVANPFTLLLIRYAEGKNPNPRLSVGSRGAADVFRRSPSFTGKSSSNIINACRPSANTSAPRPLKTQRPPSSKSSPTSIGSPKKPTQNTSSPSY